ncbi:MAG: oligosaccharide flippase family protein [Alistipes shahii]
MPAATGIQAVQNVTFPALAKIRDDAPRFAEGYRQVVMVVSYVMFPIMLGMSAVARDMFAVLLGEEWMPTVPYFEAVCLAGLFSPIAVIGLQCVESKV